MLGRRRLPAWRLLAVMVAFGACTAGRADTPLANTRGSAEDVVKAVLDATKAKDRGALEALLVTREEYEGSLWPEMPDGKYTPFEFVWSLNATNSRKGLGQLLDRYGGLDLEFVRIEFTEEPEVYDDFTLHPGARVTVRRKDTGQEGVLPSFDVLVEFGKAWKLMNYDEL